MAAPAGSCVIARAWAFASGCAVGRAPVASCAMTTQRDHGRTEVSMLRCALNARDLHPTLVLALRDMSTANGREEVTGEGEGNRSWIALVLGMAVLDTLSGSQGRPGPRFKRLLKAHLVSGDDAEIIWTLRNSLVHGYGLPLPSRTFGRGGSPHRRSRDVRAQHLAARSGARECPGLLFATRGTDRGGGIRELGRQFDQHGLQVLLTRPGPPCPQTPS